MYKAIAANKRNTIFIMMLFIVIIGAIGWIASYIYGDTSITYYVVAIAAIYALVQYLIADRLTIAMTGAHRIEKKDSPRFYRIVENLAITTGMDMPRVYVVNDLSPNAFATGRDPKHAIVAATTGLIDLMDDNELEAVMAHEMGHVANYDIRVSMITFGLVSAIGLLSDIVFRSMIHGDGDSDNNSPVVYIIGIIALVLAPIIATIVQMAVSRQREFLADATSAMTTRNPDALASALKKLDDNNRPMKKQNTASAHMFFANPLKPGFFTKLFSTHPPIAERIKRLQYNSDKF